MAKKNKKQYNRHNWRRSQLSAIDGIDREHAEKLISTLRAELIRKDIQRDRFLGWLKYTYPLSYKFISEKAREVFT